MSFNKDDKGIKRFGSPRFYELLDTLAQIHSDKNFNYATDGDPLSNFKLCESFGVPAHIGAMVRMSDKWSRLTQLMSGKEDRVGESVIDTLIDMAAYSLIEIILIEEQAKKTKTK